jgi:hypothetical protein
MTDHVHLEPALVSSRTRTGQLQVQAFAHALEDLSIELDWIVIVFVFDFSLDICEPLSVRASCREIKTAAVKRLTRGLLTYRTARRLRFTGGHV